MKLLLIFASISIINLILVDCKPKPKHKQSIPENNTEIENEEKIPVLSKQEKLMKSKIF